MADEPLPKGIRNNNPGNLRDSGVPWIGLLPNSDNGFCVFDTPFHGIRALAKNLNSYGRSGMHSPSAVIERWAPPSENDTDAYLKDVCQRTGFDPTQFIDLDNNATLRSMTMAIIWHENGQQPYADDLIDMACGAALS